MKKKENERDKHISHFVFSNTTEYGNIFIKSMCVIWVTEKNHYVWQILGLEFGCMNKSCCKDWAGIVI